MQRQKKKSVHGIDDQAELLQDMINTTPVEPPEHVTLTTSELPFFYDIIEEFSRSDWTGHQISLASMLAREMYSMEKEQRLLKKEGSVVITPKGFRTINPRKTLIKQHADTILSFRRSLALHARSEGKTLKGMAKDLERRKAMDYRARSLFEDSDSSGMDELIPRSIN